MLRGVLAVGVRVGWLRLLRECPIGLLLPTRPDRHRTADPLQRAPERSRESTRHACVPASVAPAVAPRAPPLPPRSPPLPPPPEAPPPLPRVPPLPPLPPLQPFVSSELTVSSGLWPSEVSWSLACEGLNPITGGAPYSATHGVAPGTCMLTMYDAYGDGWDEATWAATGWTDQNFSLASGYNRSTTFVVAPSPPATPLSSPVHPAPPTVCASTCYGSDCDYCLGTATRAARWRRRTAVIAGDALAAPHPRQFPRRHHSRHHHHACRRRRRHRRRRHQRRQGCRRPSTHLASLASPPARALTRSTTQRRAARRPYSWGTTGVARATGLGSRRGASCGPTGKCRISVSRA